MPFSKAFSLNKYFFCCCETCPFDLRSDISHACYPFYFIKKTEEIDKHEYAYMYIKIFQRVKLKVGKIMFILIVLIGKCNIGLCHITLRR